MITNLSIANSALVKIGQQAVSDMDEENDRAFAVRTLMEGARQSFLTEYDWSFATRSRRIPTLAEGAADPAPYRFAFALPDDLIKILYVHVFRAGCGTMDGHRERVEYETRISGEQFQTAMILCADVRAPTVKYISSDVTFDVFSPAAREAFVYRLAIALDEQLCESVHIGNLSRLYEGARQNAVFAESRSSSIQKLSGTYSAARFGWIRGAKRE